MHLKAHLEVALLKMVPGSTQICKEETKYCRQCNENQQNQCASFYLSYFYIYIYINMCVLHVCLLIV